VDPPGTCLPLLYPFVLNLLGYLSSASRDQRATTSTERKKERMGHGSSKELPETTNTEGASTPSSRIKRPHIRRIFRRLTVSRGNGSSSSSSTLKLVSAEDFAGIALLTLISADMQQFKDKWLACVSFGEQTFRTHISDQLT